MTSIIPRNAEELDVDEEKDADAVADAEEEKVVVVLKNAAIPKENHHL